MNVPLIDLVAQYAAIRDEVLAAIDRVCSSQRFVLGPEVEAFETELAGYVGVPHAIGVSSGSDALLVALLALEVGPGDEVITTPLSFVATAESIVRCGATPVFADIDPDTLNLDADAVAAAVTPRTRAILPVHLFGQPADMDRLGEVAKRHDLPIVEDAAQALGANWRGRKVGSLGTLACVSFFPSKPLGGFGDGGMVLTTDHSLAERCRMLRSHGASGRGRYSEIGGNYRLDELQAAVLRVKLTHLDSWLAARRAHARSYDRELPAFVQRPVVPDGCTPAWAHYTVRVPGRGAALAQLEARGVQAAVYYDTPLHQQPAYSGYARHALPNAETAASTLLSLPMYAELSVAQRALVVAALASCSSP